MIRPIFKLDPGERSAQTPASRASTNPTSDEQRPKAENDHSKLLASPGETVQDQHDFGQYNQGWDITSYGQGYSPGDKGGFIETRGILTNKDDGRKVIIDTALGSYYGMQSKSTEINGKALHGDYEGFYSEATSLLLNLATNKLKDVVLANKPEKVEMQELRREESYITYSTEVESPSYDDLRLTLIVRNYPRISNIVLNSESKGLYIQLEITEALRDFLKEQGLISQELAQQITPLQT